MQENPDSGFKVFLSLDILDVPSMLEIFGDLVTKGAGKWWAKVSTVCVCFWVLHLFFQTFHVSQPLITIQQVWWQWPAFQTLFLWSAREDFYTEHVSRKLLVYSYSTELHKGLGKSWPLMFLPSDLVGPRMHITNKSFLHWTQWVTHT